MYYRFRWLSLFAVLALLTIPSAPANAGAPKVHPTSTTVSCTPNPTSLYSATTCTVTVTDLGGQGPSLAPEGTVTLSSSGGGSFSPAASCVLVTTVGVSKSCSVTYTPGSFDGGTHTITGNYGGGSDPNPSTGLIWLASSGNVALSLTTPSPTVTSITPNTGLRGETVAVTVTGTGFVSGSSTLNLGANIAISDLVIVSPTQITATLTIDVAATTGARNVSVSNPAPGGGTGTLFNGFTVQNPFPVITSLSPAAAEPDPGALVVTIYGSGFLPDSVASYDGSPRTTTFVNSGELQMNLVAGDIDTVGDYDVTVTNPAPGGGESAAATFSVVVSGGSFDAVEPGGNVGEAIYTRLAGVGFSIDILASDVGRSAIETGFVGSVKIELLDASDDTDPLDANGCRATWSVAQTLANQTFTAGDNGRISINVNYGNALRVARFRISHPEVGMATHVGCSSDAFAIRPLALALASPLNNAAFTGGPRQAAATAFTMTATAIAGYDGTPTFNMGNLLAHTGTASIGTLSGSFAAANPASGVATGTTFEYSEVGHFVFAAEGVIDETFTAVDQPADCTDDFSNSAIGGKYGCKFGNTATTAAVGRFTPDHFDLTYDNACTDAGGFTYSGQPLANFMVTARNADGVITQYYDYSSGDMIDDNNFSNDVVISFGGSSADIINSTVSFADFQSGEFSGTDVAYRFADAETNYTDVSLRAIDADGVTSADGFESTTEIRSGRFVISDASAITNSSGAVQLLLETWQDTGGGVFEWSTHTDDSSCTAPVSGDFSLQNFGGNLAGGETTISAFAFANAAGTLTLSSPGSGNDGTVEVTGTIDDWLHFDWNGGGLEAPIGVMTFFEIYETEGGFISREEIVD